MHAAMSKVIHHDQMSSLSSTNNQQLKMKTNSKFQITEQNNISIETINDLFFVGDFWFGLFQVLTLDVFHYRKIRKLLDLVFIFICRTLKKKEGYFTADQLFR